MEVRLSSNTCESIIRTITSSLTPFTIPEKGKTTSLVNIDCWWCHVYTDVSVFFMETHSCVCDFREGGHIDPTLRPQIAPYRLPKFIKKFLSVILKPIVSINHLLAFDFSGKYSAESVFMFVCSSVSSIHGYLQPWIQFVEWGELQSSWNHCVFNYSLTVFQSLLFQSYILTWSQQTTSQFCNYLTMWLCKFY